MPRSHLLRFGHRGQPIARVRPPHEPVAPAPRRGVLHRLRLWRDETGAVTAEYAIALLAAVGFAGLLVIILRGDEVREILTSLVRNALNSAP